MTSLLIQGSNFRVNLMSHFHTIRTFLPEMLEEGRGTIVTVASVLGHLAAPTSVRLVQAA